jgi:hypothetical protein
MAEGDAFAPQRDAEGVLKTWPTQMNLESRNQTLEVAGSAQKILVYAPGTVADQLLLFPMLQHIKNSYAARPTVPPSPSRHLCSILCSILSDVLPRRVKSTRFWTAGRCFTAAERALCVRLLMPGAMVCRLPNAPIDVMCNQWAKAAYDICPFVNNTHVYDTEGVNSGADYTEALGVIKVGEGRRCQPILPTALVTSSG